MAEVVGTIEPETIPATETPPMTDGFHLVIDAFKLNGIETIYGLPGIPVTDLARLAQAEGMRVISFRHEQNAGNAAAAAGYLVELRYEGDDDTTTYLMGSIEERHDTYDVLSVSSPLGQALQGKHPGAKVSYQGPKRELVVELVSVKPAS